MIFGVRYAHNHIFISTRKTIPDISRYCQSTSQQVARPSGVFRNHPDFRHTLLTTRASSLHSYLVSSSTYLNSIGYCLQT